MQKFPTPKYKIDPEEGDNNVYPPSEDTFLFMDALEKERELIINLNPSLSLEIGSGSGVVTTFLHQILSSNLNKSSNLASSKLFSICTDLNNSALKCTKRTAAMNSIPSEFLDLINCNILDPLISRLKNSIDILLLNPPYVPTEEVNASKEEEYSFAGGIRGRNLLDKLLPIVSEILSPKGLFYLVALKENGVDELISHQETKKNFNLIGTKVIERKCRNEHLFVLKFTKCIDEQPKQIISLPNTAHVGKIMLHLKPIGAAPQLKKEFTKYKCDANWTVFQFQQQILRKLLGLKPADSLFIFVKETFCPSPEHTFGDLYKCFGSESGGILYIQYSLTPAWG